MSAAQLANSGLLAKTICTKCRICSIPATPTVLSFPHIGASSRVISGLSAGLVGCSAHAPPRWRLSQMQHATPCKTMMTRPLQTSRRNIAPRKWESVALTSAATSIAAAKSIHAQGSGAVLTDGPEHLFHVQREAGESGAAGSGTGTDAVTRSWPSLPLKEPVSTLTQ